MLLSYARYSMLVELKTNQTNPQEISLSTRSSQFLKSFSLQYYIVVHLYQSLSLPQKVAYSFHKWYLPGCGNISRNSVKVHTKVTQL